MFQVREKSGNFIFSQGSLEKMKKVMEKSGNFKNFKKKLLVNWLLVFHKLQAMRRNVSLHKLQAIYVQKHSFSNIYGLRFLFKD